MNIKLTKITKNIFFSTTMLIAITNVTLAENQKPTDSERLSDTPIHHLDSQKLDPNNNNNKTKKKNNENSDIANNDNEPQV